MKLDVILKPFRIIIAGYKRKGKEDLIPLLLKIKEESTVAGMIPGFQELVKAGSGKMDED